MTKTLPLLILALLLCGCDWRANLEQAEAGLGQAEDFLAQSESRLATLEQQLADARAKLPEVHAQADAALAQAERAATQLAGDAGRELISSVRAQGQAAVATAEAWRDKLAVAVSDARDLVALARDGTRAARDAVELARTAGESWTWGDLFSNAGMIIAGVTSIVGLALSGRWREAAAHGFQLAQDLKTRLRQSSDDALKDDAEIIISKAAHWQADRGIARKVDQLRKRHLPPQAAT